MTWKESEVQAEETAPLLDRVSAFFWNGETGQFLGRTGIGWALILAFYAVFYLVLIGFFLGLLTVFYLILSNTEPRYFGEDSISLNNPGLGFRPMPVFDTTLIRFQQGKPSSYKPYTDHLEIFTTNYERVNVAGKDLQTCTDDGSIKADKEKACFVDLNPIMNQNGCTRENDFGYEQGTPCILLKMNKLFEFVPIPYDSLDELRTDHGLLEKPRFLAFASGGQYVGLSCEGENAADRENLLNVTFSPSNGISKSYFPYYNQEGYRAPIVMARFNVTIRVVVQITCKLWAKNIDNTSDGQKRLGSVHFELLRD